MSAQARHFGSPLCVQIFPSSLTQCQPALITWEGGQSPFYLRVDAQERASDPGKYSIIQDSSSYKWHTDVPGGTFVQFTLTDADGATFQSDIYIVDFSDDDSCIHEGRGITHAHPSSISSPSATPTSSSPDSASNTLMESPSISPDDPHSPAMTLLSSSTTPVATTSGTVGMVTRSIPKASTLAASSSLATAENTSGASTSTSDAHSSSEIYTTVVPQSPVSTPVPHLPHHSTANIGLIIGAALGGAIVVAVFVVSIRRARRAKPVFVANQQPANVRPRISLSIASAYEAPPCKCDQRTGTRRVRNEEGVLPDAATDLDTHALDSVIAEPTGSVMTPPPSPDDTGVDGPHPRTSSRAKPSTGDPQRSDLSVERGGDCLLSDIASRARERAVRANENTPMRTEMPVGAPGEVVYELDGGVRLAGGPPGHSPDASSSGSWATLTLPPPYCLY